MSELECQFLNLQQKYHDFKYEQLNPLSIKELALDQKNTENLQFLYVQEQDVLISDIQNLCIYFEMVIIQKKPMFEFPFAFIKNRISYVIQKYQEQPNLLDSLLNSMVPPIMHQIKIYLHARNTLKQTNQINQEFHSLLQIIYILCKTRNYKAIVEYFPHEVRDLEPVIYFLENEKDNDAAQWETKYVLLLWLSIIILVPFDLSTIDSASQNQQNIFDQLMSISKMYINSSSLSREAASIFLAKYFCRPDIQKTSQLQNYLQWAIDLTSTKKSDPLYNFFISGVYKSLVEILKSGQRQELMPHISMLMQFISINECDQSVDRHHKVKLACRIGMIYLKPRLTLWGYKKQIKTLNQNISASKISKLQVNHHLISRSTQNKIELSQQDDLSYFQDINLDNLEDIIEFLLSSLSDRDTVVRWAAAKSLGRITGRLDLSMADDIVDNLFQILHFDKNEHNWHGCFLTLAELSRRGLLLPDRLDQAFTFLYKGLIYDENKGNFSAGASVRDAACYVAWAFARAYDSDILKEYQVDLAKQLLIVTLYDREINCRRAASAAFQEHVGRQGTFPHGIEILTEADYFTVGLIFNSYLNVGLYVSSFNVYFEYFAQYLANNRLLHPDIHIRTRASAALGLMVPLNPNFIVLNIIPKLIGFCGDEMVNTRHGAFYALGDILLGLGGQSQKHNWSVHGESVFLRYLSKNEQKLAQAGEYRTLFNQKYDRLRHENNLNLLNKQLLLQLLESVKCIRDKKLLRGKSGETMRVALCRFIECYSQLGLDIDGYYNIFLEIINDSLNHQQDAIQESGRLALEQFSKSYQKQVNDDIKIWVKQLLKQADLITSTEILARGSTKALGVLTKELKITFLPEIISLFNKNTDLTQKKQDADTRKFTIIALENFLMEIGLEEISQNAQQSIMDILFKSMDDYSLDNRGDIGSIVREQTMLTLITVVQHLHHQSPLLITQSLIQDILKVLLQQLCEKIDRSRLVAGSCLQEVYNKLFILLDFPHKQAFNNLFEQNNVNIMIEKIQLKFDKEFQVPTVQGLINEIAVSQKLNADQIYPWNMPNCVFPVIMDLLSLPPYIYSMLKGLIVSVGGLSNNVSQEAAQSLNLFIQNASQEILNLFFSNMLKIYTENVKNDRIMIPWLKTFDCIFENNDFSGYQGIQVQCSQMYDFIRKLIKNTKQIPKLSFGLNVMVGCIQYLDCKQQRLGDIVEYLAHDFPKVRQQLADRLQIALMAWGENVFGEEKTEQIGDCLLETDWMELSPESLKDVQEQWKKRIQD